MKQMINLIVITFFFITVYGQASSSLNTDTEFWSQYSLSLSEVTEQEDINIDSLCASYFLSLQLEENEIKYSKIDVDSLFETHFLSLDNNISDKEIKLVPNSDAKFVYLIGILSKIDLNIHSYSGHSYLNIDELRQIKEWYYKNKDKLTSEIIQKTFSLLELPCEEALEEINRMVEFYGLKIERNIQNNSE